MVLIFIYPGVTKKTKINAHELEALRFILRFLLTRYEHTENTHIGRGEPRAAAGCVPAPTRPASINSWQFGARTSAAARTCRFLAADSHSKVRDLLQTGASSVCVCARAQTRRNKLYSCSHAHSHHLCMCMCMCMCMYVCMYV